MPHVLTVHVVPMGEPETGFWCDQCLLPSGVGVTVGVSTDTRVLSVRRVVVCADCGWQVEA